METYASEPVWWWLGLGASLLVVEMLTGTLFFLFISIAAFLVALMAWGTRFDVYAQGLAFAVALVAAVAAWRQLRPQLTGRLEQREGAQGLNNRMAGMVGREAVLAEGISNGRGRIRLEDSYWVVTGEDGLPAGTPVRIVGVEGMILRVHPR